MTTTSPIFEKLKTRFPQSVVRQCEPLAKRTTLRVGGVAEVYVEPSSEAELSHLVQTCHEERVAFTMLGRGSNLLIRDGGLRGVVVCLAHPSFSIMEVEDCVLRCGAGTRLKAVAAKARESSLGGLEFLEGIPGCVGGALRMNAGAMGSAIFDLVTQVRFMDSTGQICERNISLVPVEYRSCPLFKTNIALAATFRGRLESKEAIAKRSDEFNQKRWASQPKEPSAGCIFKNPSADISAGKLIDELGLKGARRGGAVVSTVHGNFIVNEGSATARDVLELIDFIKTRAKEERGVELREEVEIIGK
jgi:UDP-N-acetylenolpyruvoylglucosamine reductase